MASSSISMAVDSAMVLNSEQLLHAPARRDRLFLKLVRDCEDDAAEIVCTLRAAVGFLWRNGLQGRALEAAMAEIDEKTKGQPFRIETSIGPLFAEQALWRFAGRPGKRKVDDVSLFVGVPRKDRPTWDGDYRGLSRKASEEIKEQWRRKRQEEEQRSPRKAA